MSNEQARSEKRYPLLKDTRTDLQVLYVFRNLLPEAEATTLWEILGNGKDVQETGEDVLDCDDPEQTKEKFTNALRRLREFEEQHPCSEGAA